VFNKIINKFKNMLKTLAPFIAFGLVSSVIMIALGYLYVGSTDEGSFKESKFEYLKSVADLKANRIDAFLDEKSRDVEFLSNSSEISESLNKELIADTVQVTEMVKRTSKEVAQDINEYILAHPSATISDLTSNSEFRDIAMRRVGESGYTVFHGPDTIINYIHFDPEEEGDDHRKVFERDPEGQQATLLKSAIDSTDDVSGFYTKKQSDGSLREKFMYISMIPTKTADGVRVSSQATVYLDDFGKTLKLAKDLDERLNSFKNTKKYQDMILVDLDGQVVWTATKENDLGTNLNRGIYRDTQLSSVYHQVMDGAKVVISDPEYYDPSGKDVIFVAAPVLDGNGGLRGVVALQSDAQEIVDIIQGGFEFSGLGDVYVVNKKGIHITPLIHEDEIHELEADHVVRSSQIDQCFEEMGYGGTKTNFSLSDFREYLNYAKMPVFGTYQFVSRPQWCVVTEIDSGDVSGGQLFVFGWRMILAVLVIVLGVSISIGVAINKVFGPKISETYEKR
jgi:hypothetical protein